MYPALLAAAGSAVPPELFAALRPHASQMLRDAARSSLENRVTTEFAYLNQVRPEIPTTFTHPGGSSSGSAAAVAAGSAPCRWQSDHRLRDPARSLLRRHSVQADALSYPNSGACVFFPHHGQIGFFTQDLAWHHIGRVSVCRPWRSVSAPATLLSWESPPVPTWNRQNRKGCRHWFGKGFHPGSQIDGVPTALNSTRRSFPVSPPTTGPV